MSIIQPGVLAAKPCDAKQSIVSEAQISKRLKTTPLVSLISGSIAGGVEATITASNCPQLAYSLPYLIVSLVPVRICQDKSAASEYSITFLEPPRCNRSHGARTWCPLHLHGLLNPRLGNRVQSWRSFPVIRLHKEYASR